ncbi:unnamed protein product [Commensalibacter communis]|uniref:DUF6338 family protein n=1 Tax=Commensalibacter communis TaxID=2972786 RepID=UPI0022FF8221|nr:DUF6338 family protein [Commensalibacter communis]CAI3957796.1 unnamed protein product [Commensalibacter communis]CAI3958482.1 unnamed protein product [Commensalibacter communis]
MKIDFFLLQIAILLLPGFLWAKIDIDFAKRRKSSENQFVIRAFVFGVFTYFIEFVIFKIFNQSFILMSETDKTAIINNRVLQELLWAIVIASISSIIWLYVKNYKLITRFLQTIRATNRYGDQDVWDFVFNSDKMKYVHIKDYDKQIIYSGTIQAFSEVNDIRELFLLDVKTYDLAGIELYNAPYMYVSLQIDSIVIEFPQYQDEQEEST